MPVRQRFVYEWPDGVTPIKFDQWISNLPDQEKKEFFEAKQRQISHRTNAITNGQMIIDHGTYVWKDQNTANLNKPTDDIWYQYFKRYLDETNTIFQVKEEPC